MKTEKAFKMIGNIDPLEMAKPSHTPTPWTSEYSTVYGPRTHDDEMGKEIVCSTVTREDAAYIVKCVNAHEGLVKACKAVLRQANTYCTDQETGETPYELVKQALAQAEGK